MPFFHKILPITRMLLRGNSSISTFKSKVAIYQTSTNHFRCISIEPRRSKALKAEKEKVRIYILQQYIDYVKKYTQALQTRFPTAMNMYRVFSTGIKEFLVDLKRYIRLRITVVKDKGFSNLSLKDIELYKKMPSDMWKIAPVLILSAIPFGNYVIFPLAFLRPKILLCSHFWSIQQRSEFSIQHLSKRLKNNKPVFRCLQAKVEFISDDLLKTKWQRIVALIGSGSHPSPTDMLQCKALFTFGPYDLNSLTYAHKGYLLHMHGLRKGLRRTNKLKYLAFLLLEMDKAILREGGVDSLGTEALRYACTLRGLNSTHLTNQNLKDWLRKWLTISQNTDKNSYSLILHSPLLLAYNHPQNWVLIYNVRVTK